MSNLVMPGVGSPREPFESTAARTGIT